MNISVMLRHGIIKISPYLYITLRYIKAFHHIPNYNEPKRYSEKIACRILYDHDPLYTRCADKVEVRNYIREKIPNADKFFPYWYGVYSNPDDIKWDSLPNSFVLKSNHACGHVIIVKDKNKFKLKSNWRGILHQWLNTNWYYEYGEWQYKNIKPKIICEEVLDANITDYRIFCFEGKPYFIRATVHDSKARTGFGVGVYDTEWNKFPLWQDNDNYIEVPKPKSLKTMLDIARRLSEDFRFVRVDLYDVNGKTYFSELTLTPNGGIYKFKPDDWDLKLGLMIQGDMKKRR